MRPASTAKALAPKRPSSLPTANAAPVLVAGRHSAVKLRAPNAIFSIGERLRSWLEFGRVN